MIRPFRISVALALAFALLHACHGLLGGRLRLVFAHHLHAWFHFGHHGACVGGGIEAHKVGPRHQGQSGRGKCSEQDTRNCIPLHSLSPFYAARGQDLAPAAVTAKRRHSRGGPGRLTTSRPRMRKQSKILRIPFPIPCGYRFAACDVWNARPKDDPGAF